VSQTISAIARITCAFCQGRGGHFNVKESTKLNLPGENLLKKSKEALSRFRSLREDFRRREKKTKADLEEAGSIRRKLGERFKWRQSLP
jgi:hypothetical protein